MKELTLTDHPMCAKCKRPVQILRRAYDMSRNVTLFIAECHGETEEVLLTDKILVDALTIEFGEAFKEKRTEHRPVRQIRSYQRKS